MKFLGSYPAAGDQGPARRAEVEESRQRATEWLDDLRGRIIPG